MEPTRVETQKIDSTSDDEHIEGRFSEIVPNEERASGFWRLEPPL